MGTGGPSASSTPTILVVSYVLLLLAFALDRNQQQTQTFWKRHIKQITCSSTVFGSLSSVIKKQTTNYYLFIIHYSLFIEPCASKAFLVTRAGIEPALPAWEAGVLTAWPTSHIFDKGLVVSPLSFGAPSGARTRDTLIKSQVLYQLS